MARSRDIRPEFFTDEKVGELPYGARILFIGIWCHSDLRGVFEYSAKQLRVLIFPFDEGLTSVSAQEWLQILEDRGFIYRFEAEGKTWGCVKNWHHQGISGREKEIGTKRPPPPGTTQGQPRDNLGHTQVASPSPSSSSASASASAPAFSSAKKVCGPDEHDICAPSQASPASDADRWGYVRSEPWAKQLIAAGCKIGAQSWPAWRALTDRWPVARVAEMAATVTATERFSDAVEEALKKSGGQSTAAAIARKTIKMDFTSHLQKTP